MKEEKIYYKVVKERDENFYSAIIDQSNFKCKVYEPNKWVEAKPELLKYNLGLFCFSNLDAAQSFIEIEWGTKGLRIFTCKIESILSLPKLSDINSITIKKFEAIAKTKKENKYLFSYPWPNNTIVTNKLMLLNQIEV